MISKLVWIMLVLSIFLLACNTGPVVYDDYIDSFRYKPECEWDYINDLGPSDTPVIMEKK